jgi:hypothetical protein
LTIRAWGARRGLVEGLGLLIAAGLVIAGLSACGAPAYTYVTDSTNSTYYKVPAGWHQLSASSIDKVIEAAGGSGQGIWMSAFDAGRSPAASNFLSFRVSRPFVFSEVGTLSSDASNQMSYNGLRDFLFPVSDIGRATADETGQYPLTDFKSVADDTITASNGVHGVREIFQYTYNGVADTFDEVSLTNADQTVVYFIIVHCTITCYSQYQSDINTVMSSFTVGSSS